LIVEPAKYSKCANRDDKMGNSCATAEEIKAKTNEVLADDPSTTPQQPDPATTEASQPQQNETPAQ